VLTEKQLRAWIDQALTDESAALKAIRSRTEALGVPHEELFPSQVMLLRTLMLASKSREVLELGTFLGYGSTGFAEALDALGGGRLTTVDRDPKLSEQAQAASAVHSSATTVEFLTGDAAEVCAELLEGGRRFDLILLDVAESHYPSLYDGCVELLRPSGILAVDNVLMITADGWESDENVVVGPASGPLSPLRDLISKAAADKRVWPSIVPLGSGVLLCAKR
jgi:predicted O-methyltransferase YrrM